MIDAKAEAAPGVEFDAGTAGDHYLGTFEALVAAGVLTAEQWPAGASATYFNGMKVDGRTVKKTQDERWMNIRFVGRNLRVTKGITREERARRQQAREEEARSEPLKDPGIDRAKNMDYAGSAALMMGAKVLVCGERATISGPHVLRRVRSDEGQFKGEKSLVDYRPGYCCRMDETGEEFFYPAYMIRTIAGARTHLRAVGQAPRVSEIRFSIRSLS